jgi:hypothetical protein
MVYLKLMSFMRDTFGGRAKDIAQEAMEAAGIIDIDLTSKVEKKKFADHILKMHLNYSAQKNRYLYDSLLKSLEISDLFDLKQFREAEKETKKQENIVLTAFQSYWHSVEHSFSKYEVILNLFWLKGVEAELNGADKNYVNEIINKSLISVKKDMDESYRQLVEDLDLSKHIRKVHHDSFKIRIFKEPGVNDEESKLDEDSKFLYSGIEEVKERVESTHARIKLALFTTLDKEFALRKVGKNDEQLISNLKGLIVTEYKSLNQIAIRKYKEFEKIFT